MDPLKGIKGVSTKSSIMGAAQAHADMHHSVRHKAENSAERRRQRHEEMEAQIKLNNPLGKGVAS